MRWLAPVSAMGTQRSRGIDSRSAEEVLGSTRMIMIVSVWSPMFSSRLRTLSPSGRPDASSTPTIR